MEIGFSPFEASQQCKLRDWVFNVQLAFSDFGALWQTYRRALLRQCLSRSFSRLRRYRLPIIEQSGFS